MFSCETCEIFKNIFFTENFWWLFLAKNIQSSYRGNPMNFQWHQNFLLQLVGIYEIIDTLNKLAQFSKFYRKRLVPETPLIDLRTYSSTILLNMTLVRVLKIVFAEHHQVTASIHALKNMVVLTKTNQELVQSWIN